MSSANKKELRTKTINETVLREMEGLSGFEFPMPCVPYPRFFIVRCRRARQEGRGIRRRGRGQGAPAAKTEVTWMRTIVRWKKAKRTTHHYSSAGAIRGVAVSRSAVLPGGLHVQSGHKSGAIIRNHTQSGSNQVAIRRNQGRYTVTSSMPVCRALCRLRVAFRCFICGPGPHRARTGLVFCVFVFWQTPPTTKGGAKMPYGGSTGSSYMSKPSTCT